jgi:hypothetical protein
MSIATITAYALLLTAMLAGLLRQRQARSFGVWKMLCQQVQYPLMMNALALINMPKPLGMDMDCSGGGSRGAHSSKCGFVEVWHR